MIIFGLKMMVKSGLEKFILKFHVPFQSCCCPVQKKLPRKAELAWLVISEGARGISKYFFSRPLFTIIFKPKMIISRLKILVTYSSRTRWCEQLCVLCAKLIVDISNDQNLHVIKTSFSKIQLLLLYH